MIKKIQFLAVIFLLMTTTASTGNDRKYERTRDR